MELINTDISEITVEIEDKVYPVAAKTVDVAEQLLAAQRKYDGEPEYKLWRAELEILLGREAAQELFHDGRKENLDRMQRIRAGVLRAFERNADDLRQAEADAQRAQLAAMSDFMRQLLALSKADKPTIRRPS